MLALSSTTGIGWTLMTELSTGSMDRMLVTPLTRTSLLVGRMTKEVLTLLTQAALIIGLGALSMRWPAHRGSSSHSSTPSKNSCFSRCCSH
ncbi:hypothetical protein AB5J62_37260 [Amycolatopsis sp. cg5]|uniref:hypothetical protein n=1 Tax=Amycolatopsis sp. cg5 TaxID=3238802 RepID=UPI0035243354